jgi:hypothetical protein
MHQWYAPGGWSAWESLGVGVTGDLAACAWGPDRIDVFARGDDGQLLHAAWDGAGWTWDG